MPSSRSPAAADRDPSTRAGPRGRRLPAAAGRTTRPPAGSAAAPLQPPADRALRPRCGPALRAHGAAWRAASPCPGRGGWADRRVKEVSGSPQPAGRNAGAARFFAKVVDGLLVLGHGLLEAIQFPQRLQSVLLEH